MFVSAGRVNVVFSRTKSALESMSFSLCIEKIGYKSFCKILFSCINNFTSRARPFTDLALISLKIFSVYHSILSRSTILCFSRLRKHRYGISTANARRTGVQAISGSRVKRKVVKPPSTSALITTPTAKELIR